jgi:hypothetical protein
MTSRITYHRLCPGRDDIPLCHTVLPSRSGMLYRYVVLNVYALYREATQWWFHLVVDLRTNGTVYKRTHETHMGKKFENSPKLSNTFKCIRKWFYLNVLVLLHWNKCNRATFFGKYIILWGGVPSLRGGTPWRSYDLDQSLICFFCRYIKNTL